MKLKDLFETPLYGGDLTKQADQFVEKNLQYFKSLPKTGEIENFEVRSNNTYMTLWDTELIAVIKTARSGNDVEIDDLWVKSSYRGQKVLSKMLWYLKSRENFKRIILGSIHSDVTVEIVKSGLSKFDKYWERGDERVKFDSSNLDPFYQSMKWKLVLENQDEDLENFPKLNLPESGFVKMTYDWQIK